MRRQSPIARRDRRPRMRARIALCAQVRRNVLAAVTVVARLAFADGKRPLSRCSATWAPGYAPTCWITRIGQSASDRRFPWLPHGHSCRRQSLKLSMLSRDFSLPRWVGDNVPMATVYFTLLEPFPFVTGQRCPIASSRASLYTRGCECGSHPAFPAPSSHRGTRTMHHSGISCRGNAGSHPLRGCARACGR